MGSPHVDHVMQFFDAGHLPSHLQPVMEACSELADDMVRLLGPDGGPELTVGLRKLLEAKDCFVRAAVQAHKVDVSS